ncbi:c-type cytochrome [Nitratiruptor tergarcus]|uniref:c-type cytochrome n=1 Tax=Nitratiruptor tergarcus TaxID=269259 RepID=UPI000A044C71|nr:c-type cytochrome [Nitratiruptor tergarcus]
MKKSILLLLPLILFLIAFMSKKHETKKSIVNKKHELSHTKQIDVNCSRCFEQYIEDVINNGSNIFNYPTSPMPAHTVSPEDAKKIAAFLTTLQGFKPSHPEWVIEGKYLFYGNCVGCHSNSGKGKKGYFPDLTRKPLAGIELLRRKQ